MTPSAGAGHLAADEIVNVDPRAPSKLEGGRFAELLGRSCFSFLEGASHPEEMVQRARELSLDAIALCDRDGLYGSVRAHTEGKKCGQRLIVGAEITLQGDRGAEPLAKELPRIALLVEDHRGYQNLCRLLTCAHADHSKGEARIDMAGVAGAAAGLTAILPLDEASLCVDETLGVLHDAFGDHAVVATWRHLTTRDPERSLLAKQAEARYGLRVVASARPLYHRAGRKPVADVLHCIRSKQTLDGAGTALGGNCEAYLRSATQMSALFKDHPEWVAHTVEIAGRCRFSLHELRYRFPSEELCLGGETPDLTLRRLTQEGCQSRYPAGTPGDVAAQIERELALIAKLDVAPFFLSVHQIVTIARARQILCQGRGSAANSAVCFALGVTAVDPARSNLLFERFLSAERAEPPDIDVDFEHERREEVIQEIYARYGRGRAAMVSEVIRYRGKSALREVGKVFGLSLEQVDRLSGLVTHHDSGGVTAQRVAECGFDPKDAWLRQVLHLARAIEGFPRHLSIHVGGFVLSAEPLDRIAPIEPARMEGRTVIPWDKDDLDDLGFFKVDVLGLGMLTAIRKTLGLLHDQRIALEGSDEGGSPPEGLWPSLAAACSAPGTPFDPIAALARIPPEDPEVYEAVGHADTVGVFQIESRAQMAMLPRILPKRFYDLVIQVAIVRPGPIQGGMVHPYLRRRAGEEPSTSPHPCLAPILARTLGVPLFQEQVMQIAMTGAGFPCGIAGAIWPPGLLPRGHIAPAIPQGKPISSGAIWPRGRRPGASRAIARGCSPASPSGASRRASAKCSISKSRGSVNTDSQSRTRRALRCWFMRRLGSRCTTRLRSRVRSSTRSRWASIVLRRSCVTRRSTASRSGRCASPRARGTACSSRRAGAARCGSGCGW